MNLRTTQFLTRILLAAVAFCILLVAPASAAPGKKHAGPPKARNTQKKVTDAAGRIHPRPAPRITDSQRKAAAARRKTALVRQRNAARTAMNPAVAQ